MNGLEITAINEYAAWINSKIWFPEENQKFDGYNISYYAFRTTIRNILFSHNVKGMDKFQLLLKWTKGQARKLIEIVYDIETKEPFDFAIVLLDSRYDSLAAKSSNIFALEKLYTQPPILEGNSDRAADIASALTRIFYLNPSVKDKQLTDYSYIVCVALSKFSNEMRNEWNERKEDQKDFLNLIHFVERSQEGEMPVEEMHYLWKVTPRINTLIKNPLNLLPPCEG
ncbi:DgyrCDS6408 [Dimorphilus gyrociliatus]|uniref:DgyrCDS6408 n=1 Tax=Dimorphilus gyrociliatus TaxID=2664684 RepID=A0A7I8VQA1_9ANNE|nr:DgyrCDS6408 [Dimorphilus gyrociliatus]